MVLEKTRESLSSIASEKLDAMPRSARYARVILVGRCTIRGYAAISAIKVCSDYQCIRRTDHPKDITLMIL